VRIFEFVKARRDQIIDAWLREAKRLPAAEGLSTPELRDHLPQLLDSLAAWLQDARDRPAEVDRAAETHASVRLRDGFDLAQVHAEYRILRACIWRLYSIEKPPIEDGGITELNEAIDFAVADTVTRFKGRTARLAAEREEMFRTLADNISQLAWMAEESGAIFWYNARWFGYTGTTFDDVKGWGWKRVLHPDHVERVVDKYRRCIASGETWEDTFPLRGADGDYRWFLSRAVPIRDDKRNVLRWFGTNTDVTEQRELATRERLALERLEQTLRAAHAVAWHTDADGKTETIGNTAAVLGHELEAGEVPRLNTHTEDAPLREQHLRRLSSPNASSTVVLRVLRDDGATQWIEDEAHTNAKGERFGIAIDVTDRKIVEVARDRFIAILGHDLRGPLNAILLSARVLLKNEASNDRVIRAAGRIGRAADRMARMISDLLDFARGSLGGRFELRRERMSLAHVAKHVIEELEIVYSERSIGFSAVGDACGEWDHDRMAQVVSNLVGNAVRHGAEPIEVSIDGRDPAQVVLTVRNGGAPIPAEVLPKLFDPFHRTAQSDPEGLGLGLFIVREIVTAHHGRIGVTSSAEGGTAFTVELPRRG
jgi:PAS domain S-box-containing protein